MRVLYTMFRVMEEGHPIVVAALYKFVRLEDFVDLQPKVKAFLADNGITGTILLAAEGINGTIAGSREGMDAALAFLRSDLRLADLEHKESYCSRMPFYRLKVKLKKEIVTLGQPDIDPTQLVGTYVQPKDWNALIQDPSVILIDTRNDYEFAIGTFQGAIDPKTTNFRDFPKYVEDNLNPEEHPKVAMFCTGGIRCEKASAYMLKKGFKEVYHLKGGILKYIEEVKPEDSLWQGECFVFDNRVSVKEGLQEGDYDQCYGCRNPISEEDKQSKFYRRGVHCPHCYEKATPEGRERAIQRQLQIDLARQRNEKHIGAVM